MQERFQRRSGRGPHRRRARRDQGYRHHSGVHSPVLRRGAGLPSRPHLAEVVLHRREVRRHRLRLASGGVGRASDADREGDPSADTDGLRRASDDDLHGFRGVPLGGLVQAGCHRRGPPLPPREEGDGGSHSVRLVGPFPRIHDRRRDAHVGAGLRQDQRVQGIRCSARQDHRPLP